MCLPSVRYCCHRITPPLHRLPSLRPALSMRSCEPLWTRGALEVVRQLVGRDWRGLEWLTGGSTAWLLARLRHLTSIEGARGKRVGGWVGGG